MTRMRRWFVAVLLLLMTAGLAAVQDYADDAKWLVDALQLTEGSVVADIGAGDGELTQALAPYLGSAGQIYSTELGSESVQRLREAVDTVSATNVTVIAGAPDQTNLPEECCDALVMRRVYHHISDPPAMNESLLASLKPGGRLAVIDFVPRGSESEDPSDRSSGNHHGVTAETVVEELEAAGFTVINSDHRSGRDIYVVAEKPRDS